MKKLNYKVIYSNDDDYYDYPACHKSVVGIETPNGKTSWGPECRKSIVGIETPNGKTYWGYAVCSKEDELSIFFGFELAENRAIIKLCKDKARQYRQKARNFKEACDALSPRDKYARVTLMKNYNYFMDKANMYSEMAEATEVDIAHAIDNRDAMMKKINSKKEKEKAAAGQN